MYPVEYEVKVYNEINGEIEEEKGITFAEDFTEACKKIEKYYGNELIDIFLYMLEESDVYVFNHMKDDVMHGVFKLNGNITRWKSN